MPSSLVTKHLQISAQKGVTGVRDRIAFEKLDWLVPDWHAPANARA